MIVRGQAAWISSVSKPGIYWGRTIWAVKDFPCHLGSYHSRLSSQAYILKLLDHDMGSATIYAHHWSINTGSCVGL